MSHNHERDADAARDDRKRSERVAHDDGEDRHAETVGNHNGECTVRRDGACHNVRDNLADARLGKERAECCEQL